MDYAGVAFEITDTLPSLAQVHPKTHLATSTRATLACTKQLPERQFCIEYLHFEAVETYPC